MGVWDENKSMATITIFIYRNHNALVIYFNNGHISGASVWWMGFRALSKQQERGTPYPLCGLISLAAHSNNNNNIHTNILA